MDVSGSGRFTRERALGCGAPLELPNGPKERWSLGFVPDCFTDGRRFRILTIVDDYLMRPGPAPGSRARAWR